MAELLAGFVPHPGDAVIGEEFRYLFAFELFELGNLPVLLLDVPLIANPDGGPLEDGRIGGEATIEGRHQWYQLGQAESGLTEQISQTDSLALSKPFTQPAKLGCQRLGGFGHRALALARSSHPYRSPANSATHAAYR